MRRKNRKWVAMAVGLYWLMMWSAYRWSVQQIPRNGSILQQRDRELLANSREESEKRPALEARVRPVGETRLVAGFDADVDEWAELLVHSYQGKSTTIAVDLYTDQGLVPLKTPLRRDTQSPEACLDR
jgi:hypothetical protein